MAATPAAFFAVEIKQNGSGGKWVMSGEAYQTARAAIGTTGLPFQVHEWVDFGPGRGGYMQAAIFNPSLGGLTIRAESCTGVPVDANGTPCDPASPEAASMADPAPFAKPVKVTVPAWARALMDAAGVPSPAGQGEAPPPPAPGE